jgi:CheY-like chemotaxis protein
MKNSGGEATRRIFVKVFGFSDVERHALNTVFRLSESRQLVYSLWTPDSPEKAQVAMLDGESWEASVELANPVNDLLKLVWVGERAPSKAWLAFPRPLQWGAIVSGMDSGYAPVARPVADLELDFDVSAPASLAGTDIDFDLELHTVGAAADAEADTAPAPLESAEVPKPEGIRALVMDADRNARLYMRSRLALAGFLLVDEAASSAEALQLLTLNTYKLTVVDLAHLQGSADISGWTLIKALRASRPTVAHLIVTSPKLTVIDRLRAGFSGAQGVLGKPLDADKLAALLLKAHEAA